MLKPETKRRIDSCRDILVGKIPDPKSQVEQITIALIYKFMSDMDAQAEELGGHRTFFAGEFEKYGWPKLMAPGVGAQQTLNQYQEAIARMTENPGLPQLFRDIFKNAYLPYRDPETLKSFLKEIDCFEYDHSEELGNAFEYLLSVLGSQGDAGQFRTPRHIIDFIVQIVDPKKEDRILDPACGTAGFLISAYKHVLSQNEDPDRGQLMTAEERTRLAANVHGYDISPDMVRLSLVNMYLHGFAKPNIDEYDTLTQESRWNEIYDVILANPPFMSPKGGIKPHKRFSVQASRSEVLFVDYIAEHLTSNGRAGIIVPEGIIFQSQTAYKTLRKMLVEQYLVAVVSLPAGVFNPYSGVKTSILILDKSLAKQSDTVGFFKVENDGFNLGAQRRPIDKNDLPLVLAEIEEYLGRLRAKESVAAGDFMPTRGLIVEKEKIAAKGEYNCSADRYREGVAQSNTFPWVKIADVVETITPPVKLQKTEFGATGQFPIIDQSQDEIAGWTDDESALIRPSKPLVIFGDHTCAIKLADRPFAQGADGIKILETVDTLDPRYLYHVLRVKPLESDGYQRHFSKLKEYEIPLPPLEVQKEIVAEIEAYQKVIDGARAVLDHYRPHIPIQPDWPMVELGEIAEVKLGKMLDKEKHTTGRLLPYLNNISLRWNEVDTSNLPQMYFEDDEIERFALKAGDVVVCEGGEPGRSAVWDGRLPDLKFQKAIHRVRFNVPFEPQLLVVYLQAIAGTPAFESLFSGSTIKHLTRETFARLPIPLPPPEAQRSIVSEIEAERRLVEANRELIARMESKIAATLARIWGESENEEGSQLQVAEVWEDALEEPIELAGRQS